MKPLWKRMPASLRQTLPLLGAVVTLLLLFQVWMSLNDAWESIISAGGFFEKLEAGWRSLMHPRVSFLSSENMLNLVQQISINAILAFGMTLVILIGGIDLSVGALLAVVGTSTVYVLTSTDMGVTGALAAGLMVAVAFGLFNGLCASKTRMPAFIITLATMKVARGVALRFNQGRPLQIGDEHEFFLALGSGRIGGVIPIQVIVMLVLFAVAAVLLHRTRLGRHMYAIGGNREAARFTGVPIVRVEVIAFVLCSVYAGIAGIIEASQIYSAVPSSGEGYELSAIAAAVVGGTSFSGGRGTMYGTLIGAVIIGVLDKGLNQVGVHYSFQHLVKGLVILTAVYIDSRRLGRVK